MVAAAIIGSAVVGAGASMLGSNRQARAANSAAGLQARTADAQSAMQERVATQNRALQGQMYQQSRQDQQRAVNLGRGDIWTNYQHAMGTVRPYTQYGAAATTQLANLAGVNGNASQAQALAHDPGYQFRLSQGVAAQDRSAAARGLLLSGAQQQALNNYGQGMASSELTNAFNRVQTVQSGAQNASNNLANLYTGMGSALGNMAIGQGSNATALNTNNANAMTNINTNSATALNNIATNAATAQGNAQMAAGQARASGYTGLANAAQSGISNGLFMYGMQNGMFGGQGQVPYGATSINPNYGMGNYIQWG
jgi:hypothetical protein